MRDDTLHFGLVVEGDGEIAAVPLLIRRIANELYQYHNLVTTRPVRISRSRVLRTEEIQRAVRLAQLNNRGSGPVIIMLDADDDCPAELSRDLRQLVDQIVAIDNLSVVIPKPEFETWFLASLDSLRGSRGLNLQLCPPADPESVRGAKEFLTRNMVPGRKYSPTIDQAALVAQMDLLQARRCRSFDRLCREIGRLIGTR